MLPSTGVRYDDDASSSSVPRTLVSDGRSESDRGRAAGSAGADSGGENIPNRDSIDSSGDVATSTVRGSS